MTGEEHYRAAEALLTRVADDAGYYCLEPDSRNQLLLEALTHAVLAQASAGAAPLLPAGDALTGAAR